jgi:hypothetical protein
MAVTDHPLSLPPYRTRAVGASLTPIVSQGSIDNGFLAAYGQLEPIPSGGTWRGKPPLADRVNDYPVLFTERTVALLTDGESQSFSPNPITRVPPRPWGTRGTLIRPPRALLFTEFEAFLLNGVASASSTTFLAAAAATLDARDVIASNRINGGFDQMFSTHPLNQGLLFATTTTVAGALGAEEVGVVNPDQWVAGDVYEIILTYYFDWVDIGDDTAPWTALTDHYVAQNVAAFPKYRKRKKIVYFAEFGSGTDSGAAGRAECERAMAALAGYGYQYVPLSPAGTGELSLDAQRAAFQAAVYGLGGDIADFFGSP